MRRQAAAHPGPTAPGKAAGGGSGSGSGNRTLGSLLRHFVGTNVKVELKTGRIFDGILAYSDSDMNLSLEGATFTEPTSASHHHRKKRRTRKTSTRTAAEAGAIAATRSSLSSTSADDKSDGDEKGPGTRRQTRQQPPQPPQQDQEGGPLLSVVSIRGSAIRYVHFPDNADLVGLVRLGVERERAGARKYQRATRKS